jgi:hypothetical protein
LFIDGNIRTISTKKTQSRNPPACLQAGLSSAKFGLWVLNPHKIHNEKLQGLKRVLIRSGGRVTE